MRIKAVIHDWDDTITNAFETYTQFYIDMGEHFNLRKASIDEIRKHWGSPIEVIVSGVWPDLSAKEAKKLTYEFIKALKKWRKSYEATVFPGVKETIKALSSKNIKLGAISSGYRPVIEKIYAEQIYDGKNYHDFIFDHNDLGVAKPNPQVFDKPLEILGAFGISEKDAIYVGDSFQDMEAANNRGLEFYAVTTGVKSKKDFVKKGLSDKYILNSFNDILHVLDDPLI